MMKESKERCLARIHQRLEVIYGAVDSIELMTRLSLLIERYSMVETRSAARPDLWSHKDAVLIAYGDMVSQEGEVPLETLRSFCDEKLAGAINTVHILPFSPASSDGGFSVIDYRVIESSLGTWHDMKLLGNRYSLMFDLVLNHCSAQSDWFKNYQSGESPGDGYFIAVDPKTDLSKVTRPRPWPLLTPVVTNQGEKHVWTTFSADQVDLNWANPDVLFEFLDILLMYVERGARFVRLDAVAFLWKEIGTNCIHHHLTHEMVKVLRDVLTIVAPQVILLTETNVPHDENISYFGKGDEAHMVYNFALPPLLLHGLLKNDSTAVQRWAASLDALPDECTYLNFTACHDGIGVRPLQSLVPDEDVMWLVDRTEERGGRVNMRTLPDGSKAPYELNITYRDALSDPNDDRRGMRRFLCSQAIALAFQGIPAVYFHSLMGERTWREGMENGENRDGNRRRWKRDELESAISVAGTGHAYIFGMYSKMLRVRRSVRAFHPDAVQTIHSTDSGSFAFTRETDNQTVLCWFNFLGEQSSLSLDWVKSLLGEGTYLNLLTGHHLEFLGGFEPANDYSALWIVREA